MGGALRRSSKLATAAVVVLLLLPGAAEAFKVKTNRGGVCVVNPLTVVQGDQVTYGLDTGSCETRNGVKRIASQGLAIEGIQIVSALDRKVSAPPYTNVTTSNRLLPTTIPGVPLPDLPIVPDLPVDIPSLPELPDLPLPGDPDFDSDATYTRVDYSLQLDRNQGKRAKRKPEKWRKRSGCERVTKRNTNDTLICQSFAETG